MCWPLMSTISHPNSIQTKKNWPRKPVLLKVASNCYKGSLATTSRKVNMTQIISEILNQSVLNTNSVSLKTKEINNTNTKKPKTINEVRAIAEKLCQRLNNPTRFNYYCKLAWHLPEQVIMQNLEMAEAGQNPQRLFTWLCQTSLELQANK